MGWRSEWWEAKRRRNNARHFVSVRHDAACAHLERLLAEYSREDGGQCRREHPIAADRRGALHGAESLWQSAIFGAAPTYEALVYAEMIPLVIFDLVVASRDGVIESALEVVVSHPCTMKKRAFLARVDFPVSGP